MVVYDCLLYFVQVLSSSMVYGLGQLSTIIYGSLGSIGNMVMCLGMVYGPLSVYLFSFVYYFFGSGGT